MVGFSLFVLRLSHLLICLNSTLNIFIYYMNGEKFRAAWRSNFSACCGRIKGAASVRRRRGETELNLTGGTATPNAIVNGGGIGIGGGRSGSSRRGDVFNV